ncbi:MAG: MGH1-like glycoside hydrolase domain-containing protein [Mycobacteriaceae bacterium]
MGSAEEDRLTQANTDKAPWRRWGPYLSDRQWGTVREDTSAGGDAWNSFPHDHARSRAYGWGEDGLLGISDDAQQLCFGLALWNEADPIIKERLFGLTNSEGNHGEDVKEYYFYQDSTPTHSWMRALYKYPQAAYPYADLLHTNATRGKQAPEYELVDTGVFDEHRYFDVEVVYAKVGPEDLLVQITATNRGPEPAALHLLPTLWLRNTWGDDPQAPRPRLRADTATRRIDIDCPALGSYALAWEGDVDVLATENETNWARINGGTNSTPFVKDGINDAVVDGRMDAVNPDLTGTRLALRRRELIEAGESVTMRLRLAATLPKAALGDHTDDVLAQRRQEADDFYASITPPSVTSDGAMVMRQALAGMLWSKQFYCYDLDRWLSERNVHPLRDEAGLEHRNARWFHMVCGDIISMPDCWEYPWFAAWDLAFHTMTLAMVDTAFARDQLQLLLSEHYLHPSGQIPAYEWNFSDVNPPVHALAAMFSHVQAVDTGADDDHAFLRDVFDKLTLNFTWWVNRKDVNGANAFEGGFIGLDNIAVFDRSAAQLPTGGRLEQADGTAWMALYCQSMLELSLELVKTDSQYEGMVLKFLEHFLYIAAAIERGDGMWDEEDGFFYDQLRHPDGSGQRLRVRSMVGLVPLCAVTVVPGAAFDLVHERLVEFMGRHPDLMSQISDPLLPGVADRRLLTLLSEDRLRSVLGYLLDEDEFLSPHGIRALSRYHLDHPFSMEVNGQAFGVGYLPAESDSGMFGGNSNWRGPVWMPVNFMIIRALLQYYLYYGDQFTVEMPTGSGNHRTLFEVAHEIADRLVSIYLPDEDDRRPVFGGVELFQTDEHWRDNLLFYEYFHGDNGAGIGASHQTGWTGLVAKLIQLFGTIDAPGVLADERTHPSTTLFRAEVR